MLGVSLALGLTVLTMAYSIGQISRCDLNLAVSIGLWIGGRFPASKLLPISSGRCCDGAVAVPNPDRSGERPNLALQTAARFPH